MSVVPNSVMPMGGAGGAVMSKMLPCPATAVTKAEKPVDEATKSKRSEAAKKAAATRARNKAAKAEAAKAEAAKEEAPKAPEAPTPEPAPAKKKLAVASMEGESIEPTEIPEYLKNYLKTILYFSK